MSLESKKSGFDFWSDVLNRSQYIVAPMVDQSELAWRMLSRRYGAQLCYTPMYHSSVFIKDPQYRKDALQSCLEDRPLILQFCANDPEVLLEASKLVEDHCDAIDLNLGCPQMIARRGHYGAFLQDDWDLIEEMDDRSLDRSDLKDAAEDKSNMERTVEYAKMLERAGCQVIYEQVPRGTTMRPQHLRKMAARMHDRPTYRQSRLKRCEDASKNIVILLTVHGRTREMKGRVTGLANWEYVRAIKKAVNIPVFSNGNIQYLSDVKRCMEETGVDGVMTAEGNLHNPALFAGINPPVWQMCEEYLELVKQFPCPLSYIRGHVFKMLHHALHLHTDVREMVGVARSADCLSKAVEVLKQRCLKEMDDENFDPKQGLFGELPLPYWYCQPYVRPSPEEEEKNRVKREILKRPLEIEEMMAEKGLSKKKVKQRLRNPNKNFDKKRKVEYSFCNIEDCNNPRLISRLWTKIVLKMKMVVNMSIKGSLKVQVKTTYRTMSMKCNFSFCKACCRLKTTTEKLDCLAHRFIFGPGKSNKDTTTETRTNEDSVSSNINKTINREDKPVGVNGDNNASLQDKSRDDCDMLRTSECDMINNDNSVVEMIISGEKELKTV